MFPVTFIPPTILSTALAELDNWVGGGLERGRSYELFGVESSGKASLGLYLYWCVQQQGGLCAWIDADHTLDAEYPARWGVDRDHFWVVETPCLEKGIDILEKLVTCGVVDWLVVDSLTSLPLEIELSGKISDDYLHQRDHFLRQALPRLESSLNRSRATVLFINQTRHRSGHIYQADQASTASLALKLRSTARFELTYLAALRVQQSIVGHKLHIRIVKHPSTPIFSTINIDIMYNQVVNK
jgi:recombination protein RecA